VPTDRFFESEVILIGSRLGQSLILLDEAQRISIEKKQMSQVID
jgi:hypothetical protein